MRLVNELGKEELHNVAFIPIAATEKGPGGAERSRLRRCGVLQRMLYLVFKSVIDASFSGVSFEHPVHGLLRLFPRILAYICDQPEERAVLCLKQGNCDHPCSSCDVHVSVQGGPEALSAKARLVVTTLPGQMEGFRLRQAGKDKRRRLNLENGSSTNSYIPALAAMAGLSTRPFLLYSIIGFDVLHVSSSAIAIPFASFLGAHLCQAVCEHFSDCCLRTSRARLCCGADIFMRSVARLAVGPGLGRHAASCSPFGRRVPLSLRRS